jgi:hypothetical protein
MNYTTAPMNYEPVPDVAVHPTCSGLPPVGETMRKTHDVLTDANSLADRLIILLCNMPEEKPRNEPHVDSLQQASMENCDLACCVMHKLELVLSVLGG